MDLKGALQSSSHFVTCAELATSKTTARSGRRRLYENTQYECLSTYSNTGSSNEGGDFWRHRQLPHTIEASTYLVSIQSLHTRPFIHSQDGYKYHSFMRYRSPLISPLLYFQPTCRKAPSVTNKPLEICFSALTARTARPPRGPV